MLAVCRAGSKVTEVLAQYAGLSHRPSMTKSGLWTQNTSSCCSQPERKPVVHRAPEILLAPKVTFGCQYGRMAQQELNLLKLTTAGRDTTSHTSCASHEVLYGPIPLVDNSFGPHTTPRFAKGPHPIPFLFY